MKTLEQQIEALESKKQKLSGNKHAVKNIANRIGWLKAELKGNYLTKDHLVEFKGLIIFIARKSLYFNNPATLKRVMQLLLEKVEKKEIVYRSERGIKGIIARLVKSIAIKLCFDMLVLKYGDEILSQGREREMYYRPFEEFKLNALM